jgi:hypothetical protein
MFNIGMPINARFFIAKVVDKQDPAMGMRVRIRIIGYHPFNDLDTEDDHARFNIVEDEDLPWAPCVDGTYGGVASLPNELEWVFGCFIDGDDAQIPIVLGMIPGTNLNDMEAPQRTTGTTETTGGGTDNPTNGRPVQPYMPGASERERIAALDNDPEFQAELQRIMTTHNLTREEVYGIAAGESSYRADAISPGGGYGGLFQMGTNTGGLGGQYTSREIAAMSPAEQLRLYGRSLDYNASRGWSSAQGLGILQGAPALSSWAPNRDLGEWVSPSGDRPYSIGGRFWSVNPGWRGSDGRITPSSMNDYYSRRNPPAID